MRAPEPVLTSHLFPEVHDALIELLSGLSGEEWLRPTANPSWSVKDIAAHLGGFTLSKTLDKATVIRRARINGERDLYMPFFDAVSVIA